MASSTTIIFDASQAIAGLENIAHQAVPEAIKATLEECAESAIQGAQSTVPVLTGQLRDSIGVKEQGENYIVVAPDTDYAAAIEFGTGSRQAQPYIGPEADKLDAEAPRIFLAELKNRID